MHLGRGPEPPEDLQILQCRQVTRVVLHPGTLRTDTPAPPSLHAARRRSTAPNRTRGPDPLPARLGPSWPPGT